MHRTLSDNPHRWIYRPHQVRPLTGRRSHGDIAREVREDIAGERGRERFHYASRQFIGSHMVGAYLVWTGCI